MTVDDWMAWLTPSGHTLHLLIPRIPHGYDAWDSFYILLVMALFKLYRGSTMQRRASYIDRFGWSIISFDYVFAAVFFLSTLFYCYPGLHVSIWIDRIFLNLLLAATIWQTFEIHQAGSERVEAAIGPTNGTGTPFDGIDRRNGPPRRKSDRDKDAELDELRSQPWQSASGR